jgi:hypothetical protein
VLTPVSVGVATPGKISSDPDSVSVRQICVGPPEAKCSLVYLLDAHEYVAGFPGSGASGKPKKKATHPVLGTTIVTLSGGQSTTVKIKLNKKAKKALKKQKIKAYLTISQVLPGGQAKVVKTKKITFKKKP